MTGLFPSRPLLRDLMKPEFDNQRVRVRTVAVAKGSPSGEAVLSVRVL